MNKFLMLLMILPSIAFAEPGPLTRQLMQEPASLFDVSMLRLKFSIANAEQQILGYYNYSSRPQSSVNPNRRDRSGNVNVNYDSKADKIYIRLSASDTLSTQAQMEAGCRSGLGPIAIIVGKFGSSFFQHYRGSDSSSFAVEIAELFEFSCFIYGHSTDKVRFRATQSPGKQLEVGR